MDIVIPLFLFLLVVVLVLRFRTGSSTYDEPETDFVEFKSPEKKAVIPPRFDAKHAVPLPKTITLKGPAYIIDGDSLVIEKTQVRLFGVDAPELNHPFGKKAKWALVSLCKGKVITAEVTEKDHHGRTVAKCFLPDGRDISAEMVKLGMAIDWPKFSGGVYRSLEVPEARKKLWLADARQKGRIHVWEKFEARQGTRGNG